MKCSLYLILGVVVSVILLGICVLWNIFMLLNVVLIVFVIFGVIFVVRVLMFFCERIRLVKFG